MNVLMNWYASCRQAIEKMKMEKMDAWYFETTMKGAVALCNSSANCRAIVLHTKRRNVLPTTIPMVRDQSVASQLLFRDKIMN